MKGKEKTSRPGPALDALRNQIARQEGHLSALIADMAEVKARLDKLEVVRHPSVTTEDPPPTEQKP